MNTKKILFLLSCFILLQLSACSTVKQQLKNNQAPIVTSCPSGQAEHHGAIYELAVKDGVSYQEVVDSLKSVSEGMNFVNPANFPIGEHIQKRDIDPQGIKEVHSFCNLSMGTDIFLDHPEFLVFAPCRVALYEKNRKLFIGLAKPTYDLKSIKNPTARAQKAAQQLEDALILLVTKASKGDF